MSFYKYMISIFIVLLNMALAVCLGMRNIAACSVPHKEVPPRPDTSIQNSIAVAQNKENKITEKEKTDSSPEHKKADSRTETKSEKNDISSGSKSKPLKSFVPSEKIEADQAVDFPYDI